MLKRIVGRLFHIAISLLVTGALVFSMIGSVHSFATDHTPDGRAFQSVAGGMGDALEVLANDFPEISTCLVSSEEGDELWLFFRYQLVDLASEGHAALGAHLAQADAVCVPLPSPEEP